jgi:hypothetical protein
MNPRFLRLLLLAISALLIAPVISLRAGDAPPVWTDPELAMKEDPDFAVQGEYGSANPGAPWGVQVVALSGGAFDAYLLEGGLPGAGWTREKSRIKLTGERAKDGSASLASEDKVYGAKVTGGKIAVTKGDMPLAELPRIERISPTLGAKAPAGAIVLFDGSNVDEWGGGEIEGGLLKNNDPHTKRNFGSYTLHVEFRTPYKPFSRGQQRGNSGVYHQWRYETQVLDSFGLTGEDNETGGVYKIAKPIVNACYPPLTWQTYDIDFTPAMFDASGTRTANARITVRLNGVLVQDNIELPMTTGGAKLQITPDPGPIYLQSHGNPVYYRNIWIVEK